jgi:ferredoxin-NADP reductase
MATAIKTAARIAAIEAHGSGTYSLVLEPQRRVPRHKPGQFLHLALDAYDPAQHWPDSRAFSIASASDEPVLRITYSVVGRFTRRLEAEAAVGATVWLKLPYGDFVVQDSGAAVLVAGGTGITAYTAYLAGLARRADGPAVALLYGARQPALLAYRPQIDGWRSQTARLTVQYFVEEHDGQDGALQLGRLSSAAAHAAAHDPAATTFYLSGPPIMLKAFTAELQTAYGVDPARIRIDAWE